MTSKDVINKLALEMVYKTGNINDVKIYKEYLNIALTVGYEQFSNINDEIVAMDYQGFERGRYNGVLEAELKLGIRRDRIVDVLAKRKRSTGGFFFVRARELNTILKKEEEIDG